MYIPPGVTVAYACVPAKLLPEFQMTMDVHDVNERFDFMPVGYWRDRLVEYAHARLDGAEVVGTQHGVFRRVDANTLSIELWNGIAVSSSSEDGAPEGSLSGHPLSSAELERVSHQAVHVLGIESVGLCCDPDFMGYQTLPES